MSLIKISVFSLFSLCLISAQAARFDIVNQCSYTVWPAAIPSGGGRQLNSETNYLQYSTQKLHEAKTVAISLDHLSSNSRNRPEELLQVAVPELQVVHNFVEAVPVEIQTKGNAEKSRIIMVGDTLKKAGDSSQNSLVKDVGDTQFLAETGLVSVEHQMREMGLDVKAPVETDKKAE
ncbi:unnamed protein product [Vicia faba]|uniref:Uncharacterized protein n=1 Tax=Vicia faba TaxID=3906 RepID=A0AAV0Z3K5_VICFA|nr:unnamed protein product [Vicia faba]